MGPDEKCFLGEGVSLSGKLPVGQFYPKPFSISMTDVAVILQCVTMYIRAITSCSVQWLFYGSKVKP